MISEAQNKAARNLLTVAKLIGYAVLGFLIVLGGARADQNATRGRIGPLIVSPQNSRYFQRPDGSAVYLTGSHTWNNLQDMSGGEFDFSQYLEWMMRNHYNFVRLWAWESTSLDWEAGQPSVIGPFIYPRTGSSNASDGQPKYDLSKFDEAYFDRLRARVVAAGKAGIYVSVMLFNGWSSEQKLDVDPWHSHPFNRDNNVSGADGDPQKTGNGLAIKALSNSAMYALELLYVRKVLATVGDLDNVLYEIANEADPQSTAWQYELINYIRSFEAARGTRHPIGMTFQYPRGSNKTLLDGPADWVSPGGEDTKIDSFPLKNKVVIVDTDHVFGVGGDAVFIWRQFLRGYNTAYMDTLAGTGVGGSSKRTVPIQSSGRVGQTQTANFAGRLDLNAALPLSDCYCLSEPGSRYLVLVEGNMTVDLSAASGVVLRAEWLDIDGDRVSSGGTITGGSPKQLLSPPTSSGPYVLFLNR